MVLKVLESPARPTRFRGREREGSTNIRQPAARDRNAGCNSECRSSASLQQDREMVSVFESKIREETWGELEWEITPFEMSVALIRGQGTSPSVAQFCRMILEVLFLNSSLSSR